MTRAESSIVKSSFCWISSLFADFLSITFGPASFANAALLVVSWKKKDIRDSAICLGFSRTIYDFCIKQNMVSQTRDVH